MSNKIQVRRGTAAGRPTFDSGEPGLDTDAVRAWIGTTEGNRELQMKGSTTDYTIYVATSALGGVSSASGATGKVISQGTSAAYAANKLLDSSANFTSATHLNKPVYNATDDTWAKITSIESVTAVVLSADILNYTGKSYKVCSAFDNIPDAFNVADAGYNANITIRVSDGAFSSVLTLIGKTAGAAKTLTLQGSTTATTTVSGETSIYQKINLKNITFTKRIFEYFGADVDWTTCVTSGDDGFLLLKSTFVANTFRTSSVIVIENDPAVYTSISSTVTKGYTIYVATSTYGGSDAVGDGLKITQGTATSTSASKLVDSTANFNSTDHLNKTLYNSTDDTWAQITAIDSTTQVSISADIMASGEAYVIANAVATIQKGIDLVPGTVNCNTTIKTSNGTYGEAVIVRGKTVSGNFTVALQGMLITILSAQTATSGAARTITKTAAGRTVNEDRYRFMYITSGTGSGQERVVISNTADTWTLNCDWVTNPDATSVFSIKEPSTIINTVDHYSDLKTINIATRKLHTYNCNSTVNYCQFNSTVNGGSTSNAMVVTDNGRLTNSFMFAVYNSLGYGMFLSNGAVATYPRNFAAINNAWNGMHIFNSTLTLDAGTSFGAGATISGNGTAMAGGATYQSGITGRGNSYIYIGNVNYKIYIENNTGYGLYVETSTVGERASYATYAGNTLGTYYATASSEVN